VYEKKSHLIQDCYPFELDENKCREEKEVESTLRIDIYHQNSKRQKKYEVRYF
jgi:hypothetical protein